MYKAAELIDPRVIVRLVDSDIKTRLEAFIPINRRIAVEQLMGRVGGVQGRGYEYSIPAHSQ